MGRIQIANGRRIRALVVDDSVVIRKLVATVLEDQPGIEVVGAAANGSIALQKSPSSIRTSSHSTSRCRRWTAWPRSRRSANITPS